jgi:hypothetical protein
MTNRMNWANLRLLLSKRRVPLAHCNLHLCFYIAAFRTTILTRWVE